MTGGTPALRRELDAAPRALLRCASRSRSQSEFLREASRALLHFSGADRLDLWFEARDRVYHWQAVAALLLDARLSTVRAPGGGHPAGDAAATLLERILPTVDRDGRLAAAERSPGGSLWLRDLVLVPFDIDGETRGVLRLGSARDEDVTQYRVELYEGLAEVLGVAIANRRAHAALTERVKELTCMYRIAQTGAESNLPLCDTLQEIVELLPPAWQYPSITTARIALDERRFCSPGFEEGPHRLAADIVVGGTPRGMVEVFYTAGEGSDDPEQLEEEPFLAEEYHLIQGVARELCFIIERKHAEEEKARLQEQLRHADRLATIGQLAAGVAHELNEPLGNILGFAQLVGKAPELSEQTRRDMDRIVTASLYSREIIKKLMFFSRQTPSRKADVDLDAVVEEAISLLETRCTKAGIVVRRRLAGDLPPVHGDPAQMQQVLVNLVVNAIQAMPEGGELWVATAARDGGQVSVVIEDTGVGIRPQHLESIFVPFFTTKDIGEGTGLGLSVVHGIIHSHGGSVKVQSEVGHGARFEITLPAKASGAECDHG